jgi:hypothetical protein
MFLGRQKVVSVYLHIYCKQVATLLATKRLALGFDFIYDMKAWERLHVGYRNLPVWLGIGDNWLQSSPT